MKETVQTALVGVTGYAGAELARQLLHHPRLKGRPPVFAGRVDAKDIAHGGVPLIEIHPQLGDNAGAANLKLEPFSWELLSTLGVEVLFLATPHEQSREWVPEALNRGLRVIDLSAAWRLTEPSNRAIYAFADEGSDLAASTQAQAVYGMPELHRKQIASAKLVANPGCYATSIILALKPLVAAGLIDLDHGIVADAKSGVSGAGKVPTAKTHFMYAADNLSAYSVFAHRHTGEILEEIGISGCEIVFTPHLLPIPRGILSRFMCTSPRRRRMKVWRECIASFLPAAQWCGSTKRRYRRFNILSAPTTQTSASSLMLAANAQSSSVASTIS
jgi:N-acetyl-gamma-glutamyl-phosphate reductase